MSNAVSARTRVGRPCAVCSLPSDQRTILESALAAGRTITSISAQTWAPGRASIRAHIRSGHLPAQIQDAVERLTGLDSTTIAARIVDAATRARETAIAAVEQGAHLIALRAGDSEVRALSMLATMGETSEADVEFREAIRDVTTAVYRLAQREPDLAHLIADELDLMHRPRVADDLRDHIAAHQIEIES